MNERWKHEVVSFFLMKWSVFSWNGHSYFGMDTSKKHGQKSNQNLPWTGTCNQGISKYFGIIILLYFSFSIRRFPKIGVPPVIIHFNGIVHYKPSSYWGTPMTSWKSPYCNITISWKIPNGSPVTSPVPPALAVAVALAEDVPAPGEESMTGGTWLQCGAPKQ